MKKIMNLGVLILLIFTVIVFGSTHVYASSEPVGSTLDKYIHAGDIVNFSVTNSTFSGSGTYAEYYAADPTITGTVNMWGFGSSMAYQMLRYNGVNKLLYAYSTNTLLDSFSDAWVTWEKTSATTGVITFLQDWQYPLIGFYRSGAENYTVKYSQWSHTTHFGTFGSFEYSESENPTVTFDTVGGSTVNPVVVTNGSTLTLPDAPTKIGFLFDEWTFSGSTFNPATLITGNITLIATWIEINPYLEFTILVNGGYIDVDEYFELIEIGDTYQLASKTGVDVLVDNVNYIDIYSVLSSGTNPIVISYGDGELMNSTIYERFSGAVETIVRVNHPLEALESWFSITDLGSSLREIKIYDGVTLVETYTNLSYAMGGTWIGVVIDKYASSTVTFDSAGGSIVNPVVVTNGSTLTLPDAPTKTGFTFQGWTLAGVTFNPGTLITQDITLLATWLEIPPDNSTVTFDTAGGSIVNPVVVTNGSTLNLPDAPTKTGFTFQGWTLGGTAFDPGTLITADITLLATWLEIPIDYYTVTFDVVGGSAVTNQTIESGGLAIAPSNPTKIGYTFIRWYLSDPLVEYDFSTQITASIMLYALYQINVYQVNYLDDQTILDIDNVSHGGFVIGFTPTKENYTFDGWMLGGALFDFETPITGSITLDASWTENVALTFTITFNSNGGSEVLNIQVEPDAYAIAPNAPTKASFTFTGWYLDPELSSIFSFINTSITKNITLYAKWTPINGGGTVIPPDESRSFLIEIISGVSSIVIAAAAIISRKKGK